MKKLLFILVFILILLPGYGQRKAVELPEIIVQSHKNEVLHILAVIRDYSTLTTYNDSVKMYREKLVDFMIPVNKSDNFEGWLAPRTLSSKSYYHFSDPTGLDSVSDSFNQHFSWSDWVEITERIQIPQSILNKSLAADSTTNPGMVWTRSNDDFSVDVNILADVNYRKFMPRLTNFRRNDLDFTTLDIAYNFKNVNEQSLMLHDLSDITFNISSRNRGRNLFRFGRPGDDVFVDTRAEIYVVDREYISKKEAKKWAKLKFSDLEIDTDELQDELEPLPPNILDLIARVDAIDHDNVRLNARRDMLLRARNIIPLTRKQKVLKNLKSLFLR